MRANFNSAQAIGNWTFTAGHPGSITESAPQMNNSNLTLDPGFIYVPNVSYLEVRCTGIAYDEEPQIYSNRGRSWLFAHNTDSNIISEVRKMSIILFGRPFRRVPRKITWHGRYDTSMQNSENAVLEQNKGQEGWKMHDEYKQLWRSNDMYCQSCHVLS